MSIHLPVPFPVDEPMTRERLERLLACYVPLHPEIRERILGWADAYGAYLIEQYARPDDTWKPQ